eukprot:Mrub_14506.p1 GENE.Mrub_14506~~Mrub_14506.p1  ORF type:complete len:142 (-),score=21.41 Mrub_14506:11-406(-)
MKLNPLKSASRRKNRKEHFNQPSHKRYKIMSVHLSKELKEKYGISSLPVIKGDEVELKSGTNKGNTHKVVSVYRKKYILHLDKCKRNKTNLQEVYYPVHPSNCELTKLKLNKDRENIIYRKKNGGKKQTEG